MPHGDENGVEWAWDFGDVIGGRRCAAEIANGNVRPAWFIPERCRPASSCPSPRQPAQMQVLPDAASFPWTITGAETAWPQRNGEWAIQWRELLPVRRARPRGSRLPWRSIQTRG